MDRFQSYIWAMLMVMWVCATLLFTGYARDAYSEFERLRLDAVVNYAVDAAVDEMVEHTQDLNLDYGQFEYLTCDPQVALDAYCVIYLQSYGMSDSEANRASITSNHLTSIMVCEYDGYFIGRPTKFNSSGAHDTIFSAKMPYLLRKGNEYYALNLGRQDCRKLCNGILSTVVSPITENEVRTVINTQVSDAFRASVVQAKGWQNKDTFYVPSSLSRAVRSNPIDSTTVMVYMSGVPVGFGRTVDSFAIGGARVKHERFVGCYVRDGVKLYQYVDMLDDSYDILCTYESPLLAAEQGYEFDVSLLIR